MSTFTPYTPECIKMYNDIIDLDDVDFPVRFNVTQECHKQFMAMHALNCRRSLDLRKNELFELKYIKRYLPKETEILDFIEKCLGDHFACERQFMVLGYRIDMYFPEASLAVECDENGHTDRCPNDERLRQLTIEKHLGCSFFRFNPDAVDFDLSETLSKLLGLLLARGCTSK